MNLLCLNNYAYFLGLDGKQLDKAERMSRITIDAEDTDPTYLDTYAWILYLKKDYAKAHEYIREAIRLIDETEANASIFEHAGDIAYRCGDRNQAVAYWKKALSLTRDRNARRNVQRKVWRRRL